MVAGAAGGHCLGQAGAARVVPVRPMWWTSIRSASTAAALTRLFVERRHLVRRCRRRRNRSAVPLSIDGPGPSPGIFADGSTGISMCWSRRPRGLDVAVRYGFGLRTTMSHDRRRRAWRFGQLLVDASVVGHESTAISWADAGEDLPHSLGRLPPRLRPRRCLSGDSALRRGCFVR